MANGAPRSRVANGAKAVDLSVAGWSDEQAREAQEVLELKSGMRCKGCGRRIGVGFQFTSIDPRDVEAPVVRLAACNRDECDFAHAARDGATCVEMVEFVWLDENGVDAPPALVIERLNAARAERAAQPHDD